MWIAGLFILGLTVGFLSGLFGVGGGFLLTPMLYAVFGVPYNIAVGSSLGQMVGTSTFGTLRHRKYGHLDLKLGLLIIPTTMVGIEVGARVLEVFESAGYYSIFGRQIPVLDLWMNSIYALSLAVLGTFIAIESLRQANASSSDTEPSGAISEKIQATKIPPMVSLGTSGVVISMWIVMGIAFFTGVLIGLLGVGGGFIRMPSMVYLMGIPTVVAIGTDLFGIVFASAYGAFSHYLKGNVDFLLVGVLMAGGIIGSYVGAWTTTKVNAARVRYLFSLACWGAIVLIIVKFLYKIDVL